jgi:hypothetical protein
MRCGQCKVVLYCAKTCQTAAWKSGHKKVCSSPPPGTLTLSGELQCNKAALGEYFLSEGLSVYGSPVWTHEKNQLHLAKVDGGWSVQKDPSVGKNNCGLLRLCDATAVLPHQSSVIWKEATEEGWIDAHVLKCEVGLGLNCEEVVPPSVLALSGQVQCTSEALGVYLLVEGWSVHGRPVWRHESKPFCIAKIVEFEILRVWAVQHEKAVGLNNTSLIMLPDENAVFPHQSSKMWEEWDAIPWTDKIEEKVKELYKVLDADGSGSFTWAEFSQLSWLDFAQQTNFKAMDKDAGQGGGSPAEKMDQQKLENVKRAVLGLNEVAQEKEDVEQALEELKKITTAQILSDKLQDEDGWSKLVSFKCEADPLPPVVFALKGGLKYQSECLGVYFLSEEISAHGRPVWMHENGNVCIGKLVLGLWAVQDTTRIRLDNSVRIFLPDTSAVFPHQSLVTWKEADSRGCFSHAVGFKCEPNILPPEERGNRPCQLAGRTIVKLVSGMWTERVEENAGAGEKVLIRLSSLEEAEDRPSKARDINVVSSHECDIHSVDSGRTQSYSDDPEYQDHDDAPETVLLPMSASQSFPGKACSVCNEKKEVAAFSGTQWKTKAHKRKCLLCADVGGGGRKKIAEGGAGACQACVAGTYKTGSGNEARTSCGADKKSAASGATAESTCSTCPADSSSPAGNDAAVVNKAVDQLTEGEVNATRLPLSSRSYQGGETDGRGECVVCWERQAIFAVVPCGHVCLCSECLSHQDYCPMCRAQVSSTLRVYFSGLE